MKNNQECSIIILGRLCTTILDMARSLGKAGCRVYPAIQTPYDFYIRILKSSRYCVQVCRLSRKSNEQALDDLLRFSESIPKPILLIPIDDVFVEFIDRYFDVLNPLFTLPVHPEAKQGYLTGLMDKHYQRSLAQSAGLPVQDEWKVDLQSAIEIPEITYPCFCKPAVSAEGGKIDQKKCDSEPALLKHLEHLKNDRNIRSAVIQKYLNISEEYIVLGVCTAGEAKIVGVVRKIVRTRNTPGLGVVGVLEPISSVGPLRPVEENILRFLKETKHVGLFDLEFFEADNTLYFNEFNVRSSGLGYCMDKAGVNAPLYLVNSLLGNEPDGHFMENAEYGRTFLKEKNAFEDYRHHCISFPTLLKYFITTRDKLVSEKSDPEPTRIFYRYQWQQVLRTLARKPLRMFRKRGR